MEHGIGISLSKIRDMVNFNQGEDVITNKEVKFIIAEILLEQRQFSKPCQTNQSLIVFLLDLSAEDVVRKLKSINTIKSAATEIQKFSNQCTFNLKNKANQSLVVFLLDLGVEDVAQKLKSIKTIKSAATEIQKSSN